MGRAPFGRNRLPFAALLTALLALPAEAGQADPLQDCLCVCAIDPGRRFCNVTQSCFYAPDPGCGTTPGCIDPARGECINTIACGVPCNRTPFDYAFGAPGDDAATTAARAQCRDDCNERFGPTPSPLPTASSTVTPTQTPTPTPTENPFAFRVDGTCLQPGPQGLVACEPGTMTNVFLCLTDLTCDPDTLTLLESVTVGDGGTFAVVLDGASVRGRRLVFQAFVGSIVEPLRQADGAGAQAQGQTQYRIIDFGPIGAIGGSHDVTVDPSSEAAVRLLSDRGLQNYSNDAIDEVIGSVRAANEDVTFDGLDPAAAAELAAQTAAMDPTVQETLERTRGECPGDCNGSGDVTIDEVITLVNLALDNSPPTSCLTGDTDRNDRVTIDEIVSAVGAALGSCGFRTS